jgi:zinc transporter
MIDPQEIPGFLCAYRFNKTEVQSLQQTDAALCTEDDNGWFWLHLNLTDQRCQRWLQNHLEIPAGVALDFCAPANRQSISTLGDFVSARLNDFMRAFDYESVEHSWVSVLFNSRFIITGRTTAALSADHLRDRIARGHPFRAPRDLFVALLKSYPDVLDSVLHKLSSELETIEDQILEDRHRGERKRLMIVRREAAQLHRHMRARRRALALAEREVDDMPQETPAIITRLLNLDQDFDALESRARFFHDEIDAKLAAETNRQLYFLSVLTALFLPPTLVAGLFGMNLKDIPWSEDDVGFWLAIGLCMLTSFAVWMFLVRVNRR